MTQKHYTPKKKILVPHVVGAMKTVKIDNRTQIVVSVDIPDNVARDRYLKRVEACREVAYGFKIGQKHVKKEEDSEEVPQKELVAVLDEVRSSEIIEE